MQRTAARWLVSGASLSAEPFTSTSPMKTPVVLEVGNPSTSRRCTAAFSAPHKHPSASNPPDIANHTIFLESFMEMVRASVSGKNVFNFEYVAQMEHPSA